eukprot:6185902-Pleurochrysis_carterae.AAC.3
MSMFISCDCALITLALKKNVSRVTRDDTKEILVTRGGAVLRFWSSSQSYLKHRIKVFKMANTFLSYQELYSEAQSCIHVFANTFPTAPKFAKVSSPNTSISLVTCRVTRQVFLSASLQVHIELFECGLFASAICTSSQHMGVPIHNVNESKQESSQCCMHLCVPPFKYAVFVLEAIIYPYSVASRLVAGCIDAQDALRSCSVVCAVLACQVVLPKLRNVECMAHPHLYRLLSLRLAIFK